MQDLVNLGIPLPAWNALKYILLEVVVSLIFAPLWERYIRARCRRILSDDSSGPATATLFSSEIGRLTPASVMAYRPDAAFHVLGTPVQAKHAARGVLVVVNGLLLAALLLTEYGSGSARAYSTVDANVTDIRRHANLTAAVARGAMSTTALAPLALTAQDYEYGDAQATLKLKARVRNLHIDALHIDVKDAKASETRIGLCGITAAAPCRTFYDVANLTQGTPELLDSPIYAVREVVNFSQRFASVGNQVSIARGIREVGAGHALHRAPKTTYEMDCMLSPFTVSRLKYRTYEINECVSKIGDFYYFFLMEPTWELNVRFLFRGHRHLQNQTDVRYTASRIYGGSLFGVHSDYIPSRDVALLQLHTLSAGLFRYKDTLGRSENLYIEYLKQKILFALIGMTVGNSVVQKVEANFGVKHATLNEFFVAGAICTLLMLLTLLIGGTEGSSREGEKMAVPVASEELLKAVRDVDSACSNARTISKGSGTWLKICVTRTSNGNAKLSFSGGEPLRWEDFPAQME